MNNQSLLSKELKRQFKAQIKDLRKWSLEYPDRSIENEYLINYSKELETIMNETRKDYLWDELYYLRYRVNVEELYRTEKSAKYQKRYDKIHTLWDQIYNLKMSLIA